MLASFFLQDYPGEIDALWREKNFLSSEILRQGPLRQLRPECIGDRSRLDLMWNGTQLGIRGRSQGEESYDFHPIHNPDSVNPLIAEMMKTFEERKPKLSLAQIRFRTGVGGIKGIWIDAANEQIKALLYEEKFLRSLMDDGWVVEMGQKHKALIQKEGRLGLDLAPALNWLSSYDKNNAEIPLKSCISLFSQPGPETNRALIVAGFDLLDEAHVKTLPWCEWGAGYGNLTAAYASRLGSEAWASELEPVAVSFLAQNAREFFPQVQTEEKIAVEVKENFELWLADPPRPGFPKLFTSLQNMTKKPKWVLLYHCHNAGLINDSRLLRDAGYDLFHWSSVDAFPATPHHEVIALWELRR